MDMASRRRQKSAQFVEGVILPLELGQQGVVLEAHGQRVTLPAGVPGDRVRVALDSRDPHFGRIERLIEPSPQRVAAVCPLLDSCGGCSLQAMSYQAQLEAKTEKLRRAMSELGCSPARVASVTGLSTPFGYRTKLQMSASGSASALRFGFYRRGSMEVVPAEGCPVQHPQALAVLATVRQALDAQRISASRARGQQGWLHALSIRVDPQSNSSELILSARTPRIPGSTKLVDQLARIPTVRSIHLCSMPARSSYPIEPPFRRLTGRRRTTFHLAEHRTSLSPGTFFQTSSEGAALLVKKLEGMLPAKMELLADLYGGAGLLALATRERWRRAIVVEESESAVSDLKHALTTSNESKRVVALPGRVEHRIEEVLARKPDVMLLDPPRKGCHGRVLEALVAHRPEVVLYVACGFSSLMRDGRLLIEGGYRVSSVAAVDMFPHTPQLEVIVRFEL